MYFGHSSIVELKTYTLIKNVFRRLLGVSCSTM